MKSPPRNLSKAIKQGAYQAVIPNSGTGFAILIVTMENKKTNKVSHSIRLLNPRTGISAIAVACFFGAAAENANAGIALVGSMSDSTLNYTTSGIDVNPDRKWNLGGGILFDTPFPLPVSLQIGALYTPLESPAGQSIPYLQIPVTARFALAPNLSIGAGPYYSFRLSDVNQPSGAPGFSTGSSSSDWGLLAGVSVNLPLTTGDSILVQANYNWGLKNQSDDPNTTAKWSFIQLLAGFRFGN